MRALSNNTWKALSRRIISAIIIIAAMSFLGCSITFIVSKFSPPSWILGSWTDASAKTSFVFTSSDIILSSSGITSYYSQTYVDSTVTDEATLIQYKITVTEADDTEIYRFDMVTSEILNYYVTLNDKTTGPKVLYKH